MVDIRVKPKDVWAYFEQLRDADTEFTVGCVGDELAESGNVIIEMRLSRGDVKLPQVLVFNGDTVVYQRTIGADENCEEILNGLYARFLGDRPEPDDDEEDNDDDDKEEDDDDVVEEKTSVPTEEDAIDIEEREDELTDAVWALLETFTDGCQEVLALDEMSEIVEDLREHIGEYLFLRYGVSIFRPMILEDEDGEFECDFPYEHMDYGD